VEREIQQKREQVAELCRRYHVRRLALFGSALRDDFDPEQSDFDFLVEFEPLSPGDYAEAWFGLFEALQHLFGRPVDLVEASTVKNPYFRESVERGQALLYAA